MAESAPKPPMSLRRELLAILTTYGALAVLSLLVVLTFGGRKRKRRG